MPAFERFPDIGDAHLVGILMASVGSAVGGQGIIDNPNVFVATSWCIFTLMPAHSPPDIVRDALSDNNSLPELTVEQIGGTAARAVNNCIDESRHTGVFADSWALVQKVSPGADGILPFLFADPEVSGESGTTFSRALPGGETEDRFAGQFRVSGEFVLARVDLGEFVVGGQNLHGQEKERQNEEESHENLL